MISYCMITYLVCVNKICVLPKTPYALSVVAVSSTVYPTRNECLKNNKNFNRIAYENVKQTITCYGREIEKGFDCLGYPERKSEFAIKLPSEKNKH